MLISDAGIDEVSGREESTTNNRMELMAAIRALEALKQPSAVEFHTDSQYLKNGITEWMAGWVRKGWKTASGEPVKNQELWERLHAATQRHTIRWQWVKGHATSQYNNRVHDLATAAREGVKIATMLPAPTPVDSGSPADVQIYVYAQVADGGKSGGWGVLIVTKDGETVLSGNENNTSGNQLVLLGCARALERLRTPQNIAVYSDSEYLINGMSKWLAGWMKKGWKTASGDPVKNQELWKRLYEAALRHNINWRHCEKFENGYAKRAYEATERA